MLYASRYLVKNHQILRYRWVVQRTLAWIVQSCRRSGDGVPGLVGIRPARVEQRMVLRAVAIYVDTDIPLQQLQGPPYLG